MQIAEKMVKEERPIVIYHPNFGEGIIGIIAGNSVRKISLSGDRLYQNRARLFKGFWSFYSIHSLEKCI